MKRLQNSICLLLAAAMLCSGCAAQKSEQPSAAKSTIMASTDATFAPPAEETVPAPTTQHISQALSESLSIEADVVLPAKTEYSAYELKRVDCDPDRLFGILSPDGYGEIQEEERNGYMLYQESGGKKLTVHDTIISYHAYNWGFGTPQQEVWELMVSYIQDHSEAKKQDLSFMTIAQIQELGETVLRELGIAFDLKLENCVALTNQDIQDYQKKYFPNSSTDLTSASDSCFLEFSFSYDGLPLLGRWEPTVCSDGSWGQNHDAVAAMLINAEGIQDLQVYHPCAPQSVIEAKPILPLEEAITALKEEYAAHTHSGTTTISSIWLEYIPVKKNDSIMLIPYWCFVSMDPRAVGNPGYWGNADRINAFTGENLAYGG